MLKPKEKLRILIGALFTIMTIIGALCIGIALILSETLYPEIEELENCPSWYINFLCISTIAATIGTLCCAIFKRANNCRELIFYRKTQKIEIALLLIGFMAMCTALSDNESRIGDIIICFGGAFAALGLFTFIETSLSIEASKKRTYFSRLLLKFASKYKSFNPAPPTCREDIAAIESYIGCALPADLLQLYRETDGDGDLIFSAKETLHTTKLLRESFSELCNETQDLLAFAGDGAGNYFCYKQSSENKNLVYFFYHEEFAVIPAANRLSDLIIGYYNC